jgi:ferredoxin
VWIYSTTFTQFAKYGFLKGGMKMARAPWVDQDECISCGLCITNIPGVFRLTDNGKAECYDPNGATEKEIQEAAIDICPVQCIHWAGIADE